MRGRFIHCADIHLDSPCRGLSRYDGAPVAEIRGATRRALENLVRLAIDERVAFVVIAGDVWDGDWKDYNTAVFFRRQMVRLGREEIRVFVVSGNHDAASRITRAFEWPKNVHVFRTDRPDTVVLEDLDVAIHGQGFARREVTEDLAAGYPAARPGLLNIGVLHTSADGREGHEPYAPTSVATLSARGYDYWALGHVHQRDVLSEDPWIVFSGNLQGRHIRETGAKGCTLVSFDGDTVTAVEHRATDVLRWVRSDVDATGAATPGEALDRFDDALRRELDGADGRSLALRVRILGACRAHEAFASRPRQWVEDIRARAAELSDERVWVEKVSLATSTSLDVGAARGADEALRGLLAAFDDWRSDDARLIGLASAELAGLRAKLPPELVEGADRLPFDDPDALRAVLDDVRQMLLPKWAGLEPPQGRS